MQIVYKLIDFNINIYFLPSIIIIDHYGFGSNQQKKLKGTIANSILTASATDMFSNASNASSTTTTTTNKQNQYNNNKQHKGGDYKTAFINNNLLQLHYAKNEEYVSKLLHRIRRLAQPRILRVKGSHTASSASTSSSSSSSASSSNGAMGSAAYGRRKDFRFGMMVFYCMPTLAH